MDEIIAGNIKPGDVVVIRYEGPKGGPGMREMLAITGAMKGAGRHRRRARDRRPVLGRHAGILRRSRRSRGRRRRTDRVRARRRPHRDRRAAHTLDVMVSEAELAARRADWKLPEPLYTSGFLAKYAKLAQGAEKGAITNF